MHSTGVETVDKLFLYGEVLNGFWNSANNDVSVMSFSFLKCPWVVSKNAWSAKEFEWI